MPSNRSHQHHLPVAGGTKDFDPPGISAYADFPGPPGSGGSLEHLDPVLAVSQG